MTKLQCGCILTPDTATGVLRNQTRCFRHRATFKHPTKLDSHYYKDLVQVPDEVYLSQLETNIGTIQPGTGLCIEVGCGYSPYYNHIKTLGYNYLGVDPSPEACRYMLEQGASMECSSLESSKLEPCTMMLLAHSLEHVDNLLQCLTNIAAVLDGLLYIVVPYGTDDLTNSDHNWFFTEKTLERCLTQFTVLNMAVARYTHKERFIYCKAHS